MSSEAVTTIRKVTYTEDGTPLGRVCVTCQEYKPRNQFPHRHGRPSLMESSCRACSAAKMREHRAKRRKTSGPSVHDKAESRRRWSEDGKTLLEKCCKRCGEWKKPEVYRKRARSGDGRHTYCGPCDREMERDRLRTHRRAGKVRKRPENKSPGWFEYELIERQRILEAEERSERYWQGEYKRWLAPFKVGMRVWEPGNPTGHKNRGEVRELCPKTGCCMVQRDTDEGGKAMPIRADYLEPESAGGCGKIVGSG